MDERDALLAANADFYRAVETLDLAAMDKLWVHEPWVRCVHPGWEVLAGWEVVRGSWEKIFTNTRWLRVTPTSLDAVVLGDVGVVACSENISAQQGDDVGLAVAQATNLFVRTPAGWRIFHHHASPAPVEVTQPFSGTVQ
jgi:ketosteroid isomerase-like protein